MSEEARRDPETLMEAIEMYVDAKIELAVMGHEGSRHDEHEWALSAQNKAAIEARAILARELKRRGFR